MICDLIPEPRGCGYTIIQLKFPWNSKNCPLKIGRWSVWPCFAPHRGKTFPKFLDHPSISPSKTSRCLKTLTGWWYTYPSEKYEFVKWEYYYLLFPIYGKSFKIPWFQSPPSRYIVIPMINHYNHRLTIDWTIGWCFMVKYQRWLHGIFQPIRGSCPTRRSPEREASQQPPHWFYWIAGESHSHLGFFLNPSTLP